MSKFTTKGGASLFVVIFTTLVLTIISVGFTQLMLRNQDETQVSDLSQRAYNSALAGVEDAKRALVAYAKGDPKAASAIDNHSQECSSVSQALTGDDPSAYKETQVGNSDDNQAYTCVKITMQTDDYEGSVASDTPNVVPLEGTDKFNTITVSWFTASDAGATSDTANFYDPGAGLTTLPTVSEWQNANPAEDGDTNPGGTPPPILRVQYIPYGGDAEDLDSSSITKSAHTLFLYPYDTGTPTVTPSTLSFALDVRKNKDGKPMPTNCANSYSANLDGICEAKIAIPGDKAKGYLQITPLYNSTSFTVTLSKGANPVQFNGVEPIVDSTGRAADLFRRVSARVRVGGVSLPYPQASLNTSGNLCKNFSLKSATNEFDAGNPVCSPVSSDDD